ncbi:MAG: hypothetical protein NTX64_01900, partial [Elusimicrobia bacterium]|nr:hypothetical protein [Elusimicrobiota bacterium]
PRVGAAEVRPFGGAACRILAVVAALMLLLDLFYALAPEIFFDALVYHLALPQAYRLHGGLFATANNMFSGFPMLMEGAYAFMLFFSDEISAKLLHWACCLGASSALIGIGLRSRRPLAGWAACVAFLATPVMIYNVVKTAVDVGSAFFALLAVQALALHLARKPEEADKASLLTLSAILCGAAMGVKYTNWVLLPVTTLALLSVGESKRNVGRYGAIAAALIAPFVLKNIVFYRDPIYPFFHEIFARGAEFVAPWRSLSTDAGGGRDWRAILGHGDALLRTLLHPWFITVDGGGEQALDEDDPRPVALLVARLRLAAVLPSGPLPPQCLRRGGGGELRRPGFGPARRAAGGALLRRGGGVRPDDERDREHDVPSRRGVEGGLPAPDASGERRERLQRRRMDQRARPAGLARAGLERRAHGVPEAALARVDRAR